MCAKIDVSISYSFNKLLTNYLSPFCFHIEFLRGKTWKMIVSVQKFC